MRNLRCYYSALLRQFQHQSSAEILGIIHENNISADTTIQQANTWEQEISILKDQLAILEDGRILFEYTIPRRVTTRLSYRNTEKRAYRSA